MSKFIYLFLLLAGLTFAQSSIQTNSTPADSLYFGFEPPADSAIMFAPGFVSLPGRVERTPNYLPDYSEFYFTIWNGQTGRLYSTKYDNGWPTPTQNNSFRTNTADVSISEDGSYACFVSWEGGYSGGVNTDVWVIDRNDSQWYNPQRLGSPVNTEGEEWGAAVLPDGSVYVCRLKGSKSDMVKYIYEDGEYTRTNLPWLNSPESEWDPFVPDDDSFIIFKSDRTGSLGGMDLYISYKKEDGSYTNPKNLGSKINSTIDDDGGSISPDGKYFIFARNDRITREHDIYWVESNFIEDLKHTNFLPYVLNPLPDQPAYTGQTYSFTIPENSLIDDDGNETLTYTASLHDGNNLPDWLSFDPSTKTFSGSPTEANSYSIKVSVTDDRGESTSDTFVLRVLEDGEKAFFMDGIIDVSANIVSSNNGHNLYVDWDSENKVLYIATEAAGYSDGDVFVFISDSPSRTFDAPWGKTGTVSSFAAYLGNETDNNWSGWTDNESTVTNRSAKILEGTINISEEFGDNFEEIFISIGIYETATNGKLLYQVPAGNDDESIDPDEYFSFVVTSVENDKPVVPTKSYLQQNYPNPFNPTTKIDFHLAKHGDTQLKVYDFLGCEITTLISGYMDAGYHAVEFDGSTLASGLYMVKLTTANQVFTKKMMLIK